MQRKSYFLKSSRHGIAMIMAISVIVIIATILGLALSLANQTTKQTTDLYLYEQANILARSAGEYAKLKIGLVTPCNYTGESFVENNIYNISINVKYVYDSSKTSCDANITYATINDNDNFGAACIDIIVDVNNTITTEPIRIFKRKLVEL